jgi:hypothetical protein
MKLVQYPELCYSYLVRTVPDHGVGLSGAGLSVSEETAVVTLPGIGENLEADFFEDLPLISVLVTIGSE